MSKRERATGPGGPGRGHNPEAAVCHSTLALRALRISPEERAKQRPKFPPCSICSSKVPIPDPAGWKSRPCEAVRLLHGTDEGSSPSRGNLRADAQEQSKTHSQFDGPNINQRPPHRELPQL